MYLSNLNLNQYSLFSLFNVLDNIKKWWIWSYWTSPMMYGQNAIVVNEFLGHSWSHVNSETTPFLHFCFPLHDQLTSELSFLLKVLPKSIEPLGIQVLKSRGFFTEAYWYWLGAGALCGFTIVFNLLYTVALTFLSGKYLYNFHASKSKCLFFIVLCLTAQCRI